MALTHALSTNNYGNPKFIVATSAANGTHITLASAMADAVSGDTIALRNSVTENVTITPGVNIISLCGGGTLNVPSITGTLTMTGAGTSTISGLRLVTNSAALIAVTGSAASILNVLDCYLNCSNNTGITFSTSSSSAILNIKDCKGDLGTTGIALFSHSSAGKMEITYSNFTNSGSSTTASTCSAGIINMLYTFLNSPVTTSSTSAFTWDYIAIDCAVLNTTAATLGGSGLHAARYSRFNGGSASAVSCGSATPALEFCTIQSTNTNAITGAGTIISNLLAFEASSSTINTTTQTPLANRFGIQRSTTQPAFLAFSATQSNVTGDNTAYTITFGTEIFDQNNNFDAVSTFTAPVTGRYRLNANIIFNDVGVAHTGCIMNIVTSNRVYYFNYFNIGVSNFGGVQFGVQSILADMDAADTAVVSVQISGGTKIVDINVLSSFAGNLEF